MSNGVVTPESQRRHRTPWWVRLVQALIAIVLVLPIPYVAAAALAPVNAVTPSAAPVAVAPGAPAAISWPEDARAAGFAVVGLEGATGVWGSAEQHPMASVTKLATALAVLDAQPLTGVDRGPSITLTQTDVDFMAAAVLDNAPIAPVRVGTVVTQRDLIEWSLVDSCANCAVSLGNWAFGGVEQALDAVNAFVAQSGMAQMELADLAGLDPASVATISDMVRLGTLAVEHPVMLAAMQMPNVRIPGIGVAPSTNRLLGTNEIDAGKTGTLRVWGRNLMFSAVREIEGVERRVVGIIMGTISADDTDAAALQLLESLWPNIASRELVPTGTVVATYEAPWGDTETARTTEPVVGTVWGDQSVEAVADVAAMEPGPGGRAVGTLSVTIDGTEFVVPVEADGMLLEPDLGWRLTHPQIVVDWVSGLVAAP